MRLTFLSLSSTWALGFLKFSFMGIVPFGPQEDTIKKKKTERAHEAGMTVTFSPFDRGGN